MVVDDEVQRSSKGQYFLDTQIYGSEAVLTAVGVVLIREEYSCLSLQQRRMSLRQRRCHGVSAINDRLANSENGLAEQVKM
jgi:hypothetical protein